MKIGLLAIGLVFLTSFSAMADEGTTTPATPTPSAILEKTDHCDVKEGNPCGDYVDAEPSLPILRLMPEAKVSLDGPIRFRPAQQFSEPLTGNGITCYLEKGDKDFASQYSNLPRILPASGAGHEMILAVDGQATVKQENHPRNLVKINDYQYQFDLASRLNYFIPVVSNYDKRHYTLTCVTDLLMNPLAPNNNNNGGKYMTEGLPNEKFEASNIPALDQMGYTVGLLPKALHIRLKNDPEIPQILP